MEGLKKAGIKMLKDEEWTIENRLVRKEGKFYVPEEGGLRVEVTQLHYDMSIGGHSGR